MEKQAEEILLSIDQFLFQDEHVRQEFVRLIVKQYKLQKEINRINRQINALKYGS